MPRNGQTKLTEELVELICQHIERGHYKQVAARACGIPRTTLSKWLTRGKQQPGSIFGRLRNRLQEAEQCAELAMVKVVWEAATSDPEHAWRWLERRHPLRWGRNRLDLIQIKRELAELAKIVRGLHEHPNAEAPSTNNGTAAGRLPGSSAAD